MQFFLTSAAVVLLAAAAAFVLYNHWLELYGDNHY